MSELDDSDQIIAHLHTTHTLHSGVITAEDLLGVIENEIGHGPVTPWWFLIEQSDGYLVGYQPEQDAGFTIAGTTDLDPGKLFDGRVFNQTVELRLARTGPDRCTVWRNEWRTDDDRIPAWVAPYVTPLTADALLVAPDAKKSQMGENGFVRVIQSNGQNVIIPVPFDTFTTRTRLRIRRHFAWNNDTGRVWVQQECLAGYLEEER